MSNEYILEIRKNKNPFKREHVSQSYSFEGLKFSLVGNHLNLKNTQKNIPCLFKKEPCLPLKSYLLEVGDHLEFGDYEIFIRKTSLENLEEERPMHTTITKILEVKTPVLKTPSSNSPPSSSPSPSSTKLPPLPPLSPIPKKLSKKSSIASRFAPLKFFSDFCFFQFFFCLLFFFLGKEILDFLSFLPLSPLLLMGFFFIFLELCLLLVLKKNLLQTFLPDKLLVPTCFLLWFLSFFLFFSENFLGLLKVKQRTLLNSPSSSQNIALLPIAQGLLFIHKEKKLFFIYNAKNFSRDLELPFDSTLSEITARKNSLQKLLLFPLSFAVEFAKGKQFMEQNSLLLGNNSSFKILLNKTLNPPHLELKGILQQFNPMALYQISFITKATFSEEEINSLYDFILTTHQLFNSNPSWDYDSLLKVYKNLGKELVRNSLEGEFLLPYIMDSLEFYKESLSQEKQETLQSLYQAYKVQDKVFFEGE